MSTNGKRFNNQGGIVVLIDNEIREVKRLQALNYEILDNLRNQLSWLLRYCESNKIPLPDMKKLILLFDKSSKTLDGSSDESLQPSQSDGDLNY